MEEDTCFWANRLGPVYCLLNIEAPESGAELPMELGVSDLNIDWQLTPAAGFVGSVLAASSFLGSAEPRGPAVKRLDVFDSSPEDLNGFAGLAISWVV